VRPCTGNPPGRPWRSFFTRWNINLCGLGVSAVKCKNLKNEIYPRNPRDKEPEEKERKI
jgi:hypothetical protein